MARLLIKELLSYRRRKARYKAFDNFINKNLEMVPVNEISAKPFDWILIGSDQVWNFKLTRGFDSFYWAKFEHPSSTKIASYAASMQDNWTGPDGKIIAGLLNNFDKLSVREKSIANKLYDLNSSKPIIQVVDPTLLFTSNQWDKLAAKTPISEPYLFLYQVEPNPIAEAVANSVAKHKKLRIVHLSAQATSINDKEVIATSPEQFVGLFKYASFVVCSSFHGTVFSLHFKKQFYSIRGNGKNARVESLLNQLDMDSRFIDAIPQSFDDISYENFDMLKIRKTSIEFINSLTIK